jgi:beta-mannosidase
MKLSQPYYIDRRENGISLDGVWDFAYTDAPCDASEVIFRHSATLPASVYYVLYEAGLLPHPYEGQNSKEYHWVDEKVWYFRRRFSLDREADSAFLTFEGVCYDSRLWVNGTLLGEHEGMFGGPVAEVAQYLNFHGENEIVLEVKAASFGEKESFDFWNTEGKNRAIAPWNILRDTSTSNGNFTVVGIWNSVRLELVSRFHVSRPYLVTERIDGEGAHLAFECEIADGSFPELTPWNAIQQGCYDYTRAFDFRLSGAVLDESVQITLSLRDGDAVVFQETEDVPLADFEGLGMDLRYRELQYFTKKFILKDPKLWYPVGMGDAHLYTVSVALSHEGEEKDRIEFPYGIRTFEAGETAGNKYRHGWNKFLFSVNGKPFFLKGMNWTPIDFLYDVSPERYRWCLTLAKNAGIQMLRVWNGGGMQETDTFYRLCDEMGILVWQDQFLANTVSTAAFPHDILEHQAAYNLYRLRNHPSLALICGGNEFNPYSEGNAATMFVQMRTAQMLCPDRIYHYTTADRGSAHIYNDMEPAWYRLRYRHLPFLGESGIHSFPSFKSIRRLISEREAMEVLPDLTAPEFRENFPDLIHHFSEYIPERVPRMLARISQIIDIKGATLRDLCEASQAHVYEYYQIMIQAMRENFPNTGGVMPWVFKRPWTTTAVQTVDGDDRPGYAYYAVQNAYRSLSVVWCQPYTVQSVKEPLPLTVKCLGEEDLSGATVRLTVYRPDFSVFGEWEAPAAPLVEFGMLSLDEGFRESCFLSAAEITRGERVLARSVYFSKCTSKLDDPETLALHRSTMQNNLYFENGPWLKPTVAAARRATLSARVTARGEEGGYPFAEVLLENESDAPAYPVTLDVDEGRCFLCENFFLLKPHEEKTVRLTADTYPRRIEISLWNGDALTVE